jgi:DNA-binding NarL/FixJ family response regulator
MSADALRVVLAEDTVLLRQGLVRLLRDAGVDVVAEVGDARSAVLMVGRHDPDVAIVDMRMPPTFTDEGLRAASDIRSRYPRTAVLVFSGFLDSSFLDELVRKEPEALGYLLKDRVADVDTLLDALHRLAAGACVLDPQVVAELLQQRRHDALAALSDRERDVLALMAEGHANTVIAERLFISPKTLERHIGNIFTKLDLDDAATVNRRVAAVVAWLRRA